MKKEQAAESREPKPRTNVTVGPFQFKIDITDMLVKNVSKSTATVKGKPYITGRIALPREWIGKQVIVMAIDPTDETNRKTMKKIIPDEEPAATGTDQEPDA